MSTSRRVTLFDIADALGISTGTVHRALHDHPGVNAMTRMRVLQVSKNMGYRPNVAARLLSQKKQVRISVNTLKGTTSFWDEVRGGIQEEAEALGTHGADIEFRTFPSLGERSEEHTSELQSPCNLVCRLLLEKTNHDSSGRSPSAAKTSGARIRRSALQRP